MSYDESTVRDFKIDGTNNNYLITIDSGEYPEPEKKLSEFLLKYTDSMGLQVSNHARNKGLNGNKIIKDMKLLEEHAYNFWEILKILNEGL